MTVADALLILSTRAGSNRIAANKEKGNFEIPDRKTLEKNLRVISPSGVSSRREHREWLEESRRTSNVLPNVRWLRQLLYQLVYRLLVHE